MFSVDCSLYPFIHIQRSYNSGLYTITLTNSNHRHPSTLLNWWSPPPQLVITAKFCFLWFEFNALLTQFSPSIGVFWHPNLPEEGCQQSFLSLLRERALCALYLYRSLDSKDTSLHNWVESVTNPEQDKVIKMNTEAIQKLKTSGMKYMLIQVLRGNRAFNRL